MRGVWSTVLDDLKYNTQANKMGIYEPLSGDRDHMGSDGGVETQSTKDSPCATTPISLANKSSRLSQSAGSPLSQSNLINADDRTVVPLDIMNEEMNKAEERLKKQKEEADERFKNQKEEADERFKKREIEWEENRLMHMEDKPDEATLDRIDNGTLVRLIARKAKTELARLVHMGDKPDQATLDTIDRATLVRLTTRKAKNGFGKAVGPVIDFENSNTPPPSPPSQSPSHQSITGSRFWHDNDDSSINRLATETRSPERTHMGGISCDIDPLTNAFNRDCHIFLDAIEGNTTWDNIWHNYLATATRSPERTRMGGINCDIDPLICHKFMDADEDITTEEDILARSWNDNRSSSGVNRPIKKR